MLRTLSDNASAILISCLCSLFLYGCDGGPQKPPSRTDATSTNTLSASPTPEFDAGQPSPPTLYFIHENQLFQLGESSNSIAALEEAGRILAALRVRSLIVLLRERGIQVVDVHARQSATIMSFPTAARFGLLKPDAAMNRVVALAAVDSNSSQSGFGSHIVSYDVRAEGVIGELFFDESIAPVGFSGDRELILLPRGEDPSVVRLLIVDGQDGGIIRELPIEGYGGVSLSSDGDWIAMPSAPLGEAQTLIHLYQIGAPQSPKKAVPLPGASVFPQLMAWGRGGLYLAIVAGAEDDVTFAGVLRLDPRTLTVEPLFDEYPKSPPQMVLSPDGQWMAIAFERESQLIEIDLESGLEMQFHIPESVFEDGQEFQTIEDGEWMITWISPEGAVRLVRLDTGAVFMFDMPGGAYLVP